MVCEFNLTLSTARAGQKAAVLLTVNATVDKITLGTLEELLVGTEVVLKLGDVHFLVLGDDIVASLLHVSVELLLGLGLRLFYLDLGGGGALCICILLLLRRFLLARLFLHIRFTLFSALVVLALLVGLLGVLNLRGRQLVKALDIAKLKSFTTGRVHEAVQVLVSLHLAKFLILRDLDPAKIPLGDLFLTFLTRSSCRLRLLNCPAHHLD
mmetsp:Transcript_16840/g.32868  ORF Transcript_16840/g.32868 Transcript_16840/m.32868 type:complete len:211 (-) Transcript_16840:235-867(-)